MSSINQATQRRLLKLPQVPNIWEGDRRSLSTLISNYDDDELEQRDCVVWIDGVEGSVRAMEMVSSDLGPEAIVRNLLRAMEHPQQPATPSRPQKIVVSSKETQFYLRGILQGLNIQVDYKGELPLVDHLFKRLEEMSQSRVPRIPKEYAKVMKDATNRLWKLAPWKVLADHEILTLKINHWDIDSIYICVMGMMATEYGLLLYRSLDSLKRFRVSAFGDDQSQNMEAVFLEQDCIFMTFELDDMEEILNSRTPTPEVNCGSIHPLEGMRPFLYTEETLITYTTILALEQFLLTHGSKLAKDHPPQVSQEVIISLPKGTNPPEIKVQIGNDPILSTELLDIMVDPDEDDDEFNIKDDLIPENSLLNLFTINPHSLQIARNSKYYMGEISLTKNVDLPVLFIQTSRPKAKKMIEDINDANGIEGICFNPCREKRFDRNYELGLIKLNNGDLYFFADYDNDNPTDREIRKRWKDALKKTKGYCAIMLNSGVSGKSRGIPQIKDLMGFWEIKEIPPEELGIGVMEFDDDDDDD
jgi:hypothetical protein